MLEIKLFNPSWPLRPISGAKVDIIPFTLISACSFDCRLCSKVFSGVSICSKPFRFVQITPQRPARMRAPVSILTSVITLIHFSHTQMLRCYGVTASAHHPARFPDGLSPPASRPVSRSSLKTGHSASSTTAGTASSPHVAADQSSGCMPF